MTREVTEDVTREPAAPGPAQAAPAPACAPGPAPAPADRLRFSGRLATVLDDVVTIPGTRQGIGLDAVIGLVPGVGDLLGSGLSAAILADAVRARVPIPTLARMGWNLILDAVLGLVPVAGDLLDVAHRANRKNYRLLLAAVEKQDARARAAGVGHPGGHLVGHPAPASPAYLLAALTLTIAPLLISVALAVAVVVVVLRWLV